MFLRRVLGGAHETEHCLVGGRRLRAGGKSGPSKAEVVTQLGTWKPEHCPRGWRSSFIVQCGGS